MTPLSTPAAQGTELHFVFDDFPNPEGARFIEVEDGSGRSVSAGEWRRREDGLVELVVPMGKDWSYAFDGSTLRDRFGGSFMATEPDINGNVAVLLSQVDAHAIIAALSASPPPEALPASGVEVARKLRLAANSHGHSIPDSIRELMREAAAALTSAPAPEDR